MTIEADAIPQNAAEAEALIETLSNEPEEGAAPPEAAATPPADEFVINYRGKEEKYARDKIIQFAQQGRDYSERMRLFNEQKSAWEKETGTQKQKWAELEQRLQSYREIEEYQKVDPDWWKHVTESYAQRKAGGQGQAAGAGATAPLPPEVQEKLSKFEQFMTAAEQEREAARAKQEDLVLDQQISSYREKYPHFEWDKVDEHGQNLEQRILKFATENGLGKPEHFSIAANHYLHEEHIKRAGHASKEQVGKHIEKVTKLGLGPVTTQPTQKLRQVSNVRHKDWNEIGEEAKAALGLTT